MVKKTFWVVAFFMLSILFVQPVSAADINIDHSAELEKVCKPMNCIVPVPTLVDPNEDVIKIDQDFYLTGLTWNDTKIYIYVDNVYQGEAVVVNDDDSDTANFYYLIENNSLLEGQHEWKVIAWTESMRKRSYISTNNNFTIEDYFTAPNLDRITTDIDNNNWLVGVAGNNSIVSVYVDNVYQGEVRTDGNFNYNLGALSPGLHTIYALAKDADTGKLSKRSNLLSEQVLEIDQGVESIIPEEPVETEESEEETPVVEEPVETEESEEDQISSISEEDNNEVVIISKEDNTNVNVAEEDNSDIEVGVINEEESQDQLVVDDQKSEESSTTEEDDSEGVSIAEELQPATPNDQDTEIIMEEVSAVEKQERNRKVGIWLLVILIVIVISSTFLSGKKDNSKKNKNEDDSDSHQGNLFNKD